MERVLRGEPLKVPENVNVWRYIDTQLVKHGARTAQVDGSSGTSVDYSVLRQRARRVFALLSDLGLQHGDVIALKAPNTLHLTPLMLGIWRAGLTCALINPGSTEREVAHACKIARPSLLVSWDSVLRVHVHGQECQELADLLSIVLNDEGVEESSLSNHEPVRSNGNDVALILSSSGSTGLPKGVALSHRNIVAALSNSGEYAADGAATIGFCVLPLFHAYGLMLMLMCLCEGATLVMLPRFSLAPFLATSKQYQHVRHVWTGAAAVNAELQELMNAALPERPRVCHSYGLTETTFTVLSGPSNKAKPGSPGKLTPGMECKVIFLCVQVVAVGTNMALGSNQVGELLLRGPSIMLGYVSNEKATREALDSDGWLHTGDLGFYDKGGYFFLVDRIKEMIKYHAHQVSPSELEAVLCAIPGVEEAAVVGKADPVCGEMPSALVVLEPGARITVEEIRQHVDSQVCAYKQLRGGIKIVESLPKSASGKILRRRARALMSPH
ncbi:hypothetical protein B566_EDAN002258 [Ephemera danica]|nr:hypothetical protein B566_EDAN002258 [Ephemera danica]